MKKTTGNIILSGKRLNTFPLRLGKRQQCFFSPLLFNPVWKVLINAIRQEKIFFKFGKEVKHFLGKHDDIFSQSQEIHYYKLVEFMREFSKVSGDFPSGSDSKSVCLQCGRTQVQSLGWEDSLEKEMVTHSSTLAWKIPWTEEPVRLQSMGLQRVRHDWMTSLSLFRIHGQYLRFNCTYRYWDLIVLIEPGGLPSMGSYRVGHDWNDLLAAAA